MSQLTKEQWQHVEQTLSGTYGVVDLMVDGKKVTFQRGLVDENRLGIMTYVNGQFKGAWYSIDSEHDEARYLCKKSKFARTKKQRDELKKWRKGLLKKMEINPDEKIEYRTPVWPSVTAIRRYYQKTFTSIELIEAIG